MKLRLPILATTLALMAMFLVVPTASAASTTSAPAAAQVTGIASNGLNFTGTITNEVFSNVNGVLTASGTLNGSLTNAAGNVITSVTNLVFTTTATATGSCEILNLVLGPINLNLLGLTVTLNQVILNVTAVPGPGNLLGNLLCAVAHLLDNNGPVSGLAGLLNNIVRQLGL